MSYPKKECICRSCKGTFVSTRKNPKYCSECLKIINLNRKRHKDKKEVKQIVNPKLSILEVCERASKLKISYGKYISRYLN